MLSVPSMGGGSGCTLSREDQGELGALYPERIKESWALFIRRGSKRAGRSLSGEDQGELGALYAILASHLGTHAPQL